MIGLKDFVCRSSLDLKDTTHTKPRKRATFGQTSDSDALLPVRYYTIPDELVDMMWYPIMQLEDEVKRSFMEYECHEIAA